MHRVAARPLSEAEMLLTCFFYACSLQVSAWGGYVFIINLIPLHVFALLLMQRYSRRVYIGKTQDASTTDAVGRFLPLMQRRRPRLTLRLRPIAAVRRLN